VTEWYKYKWSKPFILAMYPQYGGWFNYSKVALTITKHEKNPTRNSTTSFLTATTLIYPIGAGITAAAGTRLALQLILLKLFKL
jgi:hypothetical protein